jgi:hypothetical protein
MHGHMHVKFVTMLLQKPNNNFSTAVKTGLSPFIFSLFTRHLPDDGWSGQPKHVALYNKSLIY